MTQPILHHYPQSPVSEKVRIVFGIKRLQWQSVEIPRLLPKPDLVVLTGGYRRTPVLQCGADIYCDTQCIIRELERRYPEPGLFPDGNEAQAWITSRWIDDSLMQLILALVLGTEVDKMPPEFIADRGRLYFGRNYDLEAFKKRLPDLESQLRPQLDWLQRLLGDGRFFHGDSPGLVDAYAYFILWFFRGRYPRGPQIIGQLAGLEHWETKMRGIGHGEQQDITAEQAIQIAGDASSRAAEYIDPADPMGLRTGQAISVTPEGDGGDPSVSGTLVRLDAYEIAIRHHDRRIGEVVIHFPRIGYHIEQ